MSLSFVVTGTIWRWLLQPRGGINQLPTVVGLPAGRFLWLSSREQRLVFDWAALPHYGCWMLVAALTALAWSNFRRARPRTARRQAVAAAALLVLAISGITRRLAILDFPETHGFNVAIWGVVIAAVCSSRDTPWRSTWPGCAPFPTNYARRPGGRRQRFQIYRYVELPMLTPITVSAVDLGLSPEDLRPDFRNGRAIMHQPACLR